MTHTSFNLRIATIFAGAIIALIWSPTFGAILCCLVIFICACASLK